MYLTSILYCAKRSYLNRSRKKNSQASSKMGRNRTKWKVEPASLDYVTLAETATFEIPQVEPEASLPLLAWLTKAGIVRCTEVYLLTLIPKCVTDTNPYVVHSSTN